MPIEDFNEDTEDTGEGGASSKPILIVGILGLAVVLAIATVFLFMSDKNPSGGEPVAQPQTEQAAAPTEAAPNGVADRFQIARMADKAWQDHAAKGSAPAAGRPSGALPPIGGVSPIC